MLSIILMSVYGYIGIAIALIIVVAVSYLFFSFSKYQKKEEEKITEEQKRKLENPNFSDYDFANESGDYNLYQSSMNPKIKIREVRFFKDRTEDKDKLIFSSSMPFNFNGEDKRALINLIPGLIDASVLNSHELMILKSPAANFHDDGLRKSILGHLFTHLNRKYDWIKQKTAISFHYVEDNYLNCHMRYNTSDHVRLGILLGEVPGITNRFKMIGEMEYKDTCQFNINKELGATWEDLLPKIKKVFEGYFTGGVEFIGPN